MAKYPNVSAIATTPSSWTTRRHPVLFYGSGAAFDSSPTPSPAGIVWDSAHTRFVVVATTGTPLAFFPASYSADGLTWHPFGPTSTTAAGVDVYINSTGIAYGNGYTMMAGSRFADTPPTKGFPVLITHDGGTTGAAPPFPNGTTTWGNTQSSRGIAYAGSTTFYLITQNYLYQTTDAGATWTPNKMATHWRTASGLRWIVANPSSGVVLIGGKATASKAELGCSGTTYVPFFTPLSPAGAGTAPTAACYGDTKWWIAADYGPSTATGPHLLYTSDAAPSGASTWTSVALPVPAHTTGIHGCCFLNGIMFVFGGRTSVGPAIIWYSATPTTAASWHMVTIPKMRYVNSIAWNGTHYVAVGLSTATTTPTTTPTPRASGVLTL